MTMPCNDNATSLRGAKRRSNPVNPVNPVFLQIHLPKIIVGAKFTMNGNNGDGNGFETNG